MVKRDTQPIIKNFIALDCVVIVEPVKCDAVTIVQGFVVCNYVVVG